MASLNHAQQADETAVAQKLIDRHLESWNDRYAAGVNGRRDEGRLRRRGGRLYSSVAYLQSKGITVIGEPIAMTGGDTEGETWGTSFRPGDRN